MAVMKKKTRRKLSKQLNKLIKMHGAEMALALVTGVVSALAADHKSRADRKQKSKSAKSGEARQSAKAAKAEKPAKAEKGAKLPVRTVAVRKRA